MDDTVCDCCGEATGDVIIRGNNQPLCELCEGIRQDLSDEDDGLENE